MSDATSSPTANGPRNWTFWRARLTRLTASPLGRAAFTFVLAVLASFVIPRGGRWLPIFVGLSVYSVLDPLRNASRPRWWINTLKSILGWFLLFITAAAISEIDGMHEDAMVFLAPFMLYPAMLALSAMIRLVTWHRARAAAPPA